MMLFRALVVTLAALVVAPALTGCAGPTRTRLYEVGPTLSQKQYDRVTLRHAPTDDRLTPATVETFEAELSKELAERGFEVVDTTDRALEIVYRAVSFNAGSTAGRLASAVAGFVSPVGTLGQEAGSGEVAVKVEFFDPDGTRVADTVIQQQISGITSHTELTVRAIAGAVAKFALARFGSDDAVEFVADAGDEWSGGLPLYRAIEGEWRYAVLRDDGSTLVTGTLAFELHYRGLAVLTTATVDGDTAQPTDAISALFQTRSGRVIRWWLDAQTGTWRETTMRLAARPDGFVYRTEDDDATTEGRVRAAVGDDQALIELTRTERDGTQTTLEVRMERIG